MTHPKSSYSGVGESRRGQQQERNPPGCPRDRHDPLHGGSQHHHLQPPREGGDGGGREVRQVLISSSSLVIFSFQDSHFTSFQLFFSRLIIF